MSWFVFVYRVLFSVYFISCESEGKANSPTGGTKLTIFPGESDSIIWNFDDDLSTVISRIWSFTSSDGLRTGSLGVIPYDSELDLKQFCILPRINITKPATLVLNNVNQDYDGTYTFILSTTLIHHITSSSVRVFIAKKPTVILSCSNLTTVNESDNFTCECRGEGGNPPAKVAWYDKDGVQIGRKGKERKTLTLTDISRTNHGLTYECEARSHTDNRFAHKKSIKIEVNHPPESTRLKYDPKSLTITCDGGKARPPARFEIFVNKTKLVMKGRTYTIPGTYSCDAVNILGRSSSLSKYISPGVPPTTRPPGTAAKQGNETVEPSSNDISCRTEWYIFVVSVMAGFAVGILLSYIVRKFSNKKPEQNSEPQTDDVDTTYQELDPTRMNTEDNYQSLLDGDASYDEPINETESTYTELNNTRDEENIYQSLA